MSGQPEREAAVASAAGGHGGLRLAATVPGLPQGPSPHTWHNTAGARRFGGGELGEPAGSRTMAPSLVRTEHGASLRAARAVGASASQAVVSEARAGGPGRRPLGGALLPR